MHTQFQFSSTSIINAPQYKWQTMLSKGEGGGGGGLIIIYQYDSIITGSGVMLSGNFDSWRVFLRPHGTGLEAYSSDCVTRHTYSLLKLHTIDKGLGFHRLYALYQLPASTPSGSPFNYLCNMHNGRGYTACIVQQWKLFHNISLQQINELYIIPK